MRMGNYSWVLFALVVFFSSNASAETYYYQYGNTKYSSGQAVCNAYMAVNQASRPDQPLKVEVIPLDSNGRVKCQLRVVSNNYPTGSADFGRIGNSCDTGGTWNNTTAQCDYPPPEPDCSTKKGTSGPFSKSGSAPDGYMTISGGYAAPSQSGCFNGCVANTADQKCKTRTSGVYLCKGTAWFTGDSCSASTSPSIDTSDGTPPTPPEKTTDTKPCVYTTGADGKQTCTSSKTNEQEGQSCGGSAAGCTSTKPNKDETTVTTEVTKVTNSGGGTTSTKTDTATQTKCTGMKECQSGSTTTTTTTTTDKDGNTTGSNSVCKGSSCPDKNTNPDGDGDGLGDCINNCGEGEGGAGDWYKPGQDTYESVITDFANKVKSVPAVSGVSGFLSYSPTGACPRYSVNVWVFHVQLDQWCTANFPWQLIAAVVIATAAFFGFRIAFL